MAAKYQVIARELELRLRRDADARLPTEAALGQQFHCSRQTIRSALGILEEKGLIVKRRGSGSYPVRSAPRENRRIAVILADKEEYTAPAMLREIKKAAGEIGCTVFCLETGGDWHKEKELMAKLLLQPPAGVLWQPVSDVLGCFCLDELERLQKARVPLVYLGGRYATPEDAPCVRSDDPGGAELLMAQLAAMGHRKVAGILRWDDSQGLARYRGCIYAAQELGLEFESCLWYCQQERLRLLEGDEGLLRRFLSDYRGECTAVVCHNDEIGFRLLRLVQAEKIDLTVANFNTSYLTLSGKGGMVSLRCDGSRPGTEAVRLLALLMEGKEAGSVSLTMALRR